MASSYQGSQSANSNTSNGSGDSFIAATKPGVGSPSVSIMKAVERSLERFSRELSTLVRRFEPPLYFNGYRCSFNAVNRIYYYNEIHKAIDEVCKQIGETEEYLKRVMAEQEQLTLGDQTSFLLDGTDVVDKKADASDGKVGILYKENNGDWEDLWEAPELAAFKKYYLTRQV